MTHSRGCCRLAGLAGSLMLAAAAWGDLQLGGYTQVRYSALDEDADGEDGFDVRRARLKLSGPVTEGGPEMKLEVDVSSLEDGIPMRVELKAASVQQPFGDGWAARLGYGKTLFGLEVEQSSSKRLPLERSYAARKLFPGERDTGLYITWEPYRDGVPQVAVGYTNGLYRWRRTDSAAHAWVGRLDWRLPQDGFAGLSLMSSGRTQTDTETALTTRYTEGPHGARAPSGPHQAGCCGTRPLLLVMKAIADVERIGDYSVDIGRTAIRLAGTRYFKPLVDTPRMADPVRTMLRQVLRSLVRRDMDLVHQVVALRRGSGRPELG